MQNNSKKIEHKQQLVDWFKSGFKKRVNTEHLPLVKSQEHLSFFVLNILKSIIRHGITLKEEVLSKYMTRFLMMLIGIEKLRKKLKNLKL